MEKYIVRWSYWLGVVCVVIALAWRGLLAFKFGPEKLMTISYMSVYKAAVLFLLTAISTSVLARPEGKKS